MYSINYTCIDTNIRREKEKIKCQILIFFNIFLQISIRKCKGKPLK